MQDQNTLDAESSNKMELLPNVRVETTHSTGSQLPDDPLLKFHQQLAPDSIRDNRYIIEFVVLS